MDFYNEPNDLVKNNQDNDFIDNELNKLDSITIDRNPSSGIELRIKKHVDDELNKNTILRYNQTWDNYLKVSVGADIYSPTKYDKIQNIDIKFISTPNTGGYLLQSWVIKCNDKTTMVQNKKS